jgi:ribonuclease P protein component
MLITCGKLFFSSGHQPCFENNIGVEYENDKKDLSAQEKKEGENPRLFEALRLLGRKERFAPAPAEREEKSFRLIPIWNMLPKKFRLPVQDFFKLSQDRPARQKKSKFFLLRARENGLGFGRFGAVISKKVSKSSVIRNKIKREIFGAIRAEKIHEKQKKDFLISVLPPVSQLNKTEIKKELLPAIKEME